MDIGVQSEEASVKYAKHNNIEKVIVVQGKKVKQLFIIDVKTGEKTRVSKEKIWS